MISLPVLDLDRFDARGPEERGSFLGELRDVCHEVGFFYVVGHGVDRQVTDAVISRSREFFSLPLEERLAIDNVSSTQFRGYTRLGNEWTKGVSDQREQLDLGADRPEPILGVGDPVHLLLDGPNLWPESLPELRQVVDPWLTQMEQVGHRLLRAVAAALGQPEDLFAPLFEGKPYVHAKLIRYPGTGEAASEQGVGSHKDPGFLTFLLLEEGTGGLQVATDDGTWIEAPPRPGTFLVNLGEMLEVATRGYLKATRHRVVAPPAGHDRISAPYFLNPRLDAVIGPLPLPADLEAAATGQDDDPDNPLFGEYGRNILKSWRRSHPEAAAANWPEEVPAT